MHVCTCTQIASSPGHSHVFNVTGDEAKHFSKERGELEEGRERGEGAVQKRAACRFEVLEVADTSSVIDAFLLIVPSSSNTTESGSPSLPNAAGGTTAVGGASGGSGSGSDGKDGDRISRSLLLNSVSSSLSGSNGMPWCTCICILDFFQEGVNPLII